MILFVDINDVCRARMAATCCETCLGRSAEHAGVYVADGTAPAAFAVRAADEIGLALDRSGSRSVDTEQLERAERVYGMTAAVAAHLKEDFPSFARKIFVLHSDDPFGQGLACYQDCLKDIMAQVEELR